MRPGEWIICINKTKTIEFLNALIEKKLIYFDLVYLIGDTKVGSFIDTDNERWFVCQNTPDIHKAFIIDQWDDKEKVKIFTPETHFIVPVTITEAKSENLFNRTFLSK